MVSLPDILWNLVWDRKCHLIDSWPQVTERCSLYKNSFVRKASLGHIQGLVKMYRPSAQRERPYNNPKQNYTYEIPWTKILTLFISERIHLVSILVYLFAFFFGKGGFFLNNLFLFDKKTICSTVVGLLESSKWKRL